MATVTVHKICPLCHKPSELTVDADKYFVWQQGELMIQEVFPELSEGDREILITGTHDDCFQTAFAEVEED